jgi:tRNA (guanine37-N1)-methyltransferase
MPRESFYLKVPKTEGEIALRAVDKLGLTDKTLQIQKIEDDAICIPLIRQPDDSELTSLRRQMPGLCSGTSVFLEKRRQEKTLVEALIDELPLHLMASLPRALDVVGDIAILEIPPELETYKAVLGEAIMKTHRGVRVVLAKAGAVTGTYRLRNFEFIAGERRTATLYKEFGCTYHVDVAKAYFSPRLGHEHERVALLVGSGETVVDLFAGVGPFAVLIAKSCGDAKVYAIDINADAVELLKKNARLNRVENRVFPIIGDARQVVSNGLTGIADRVIMNLPETANAFIDVACRAIKQSGGVAHFYCFIRSPQTVKDMERQFSEAVQNSGRKVTEFLHAKPVRETAPHEYQIVLDAQIL